MKRGLRAASYIAILSYKYERLKKHYMKTIRTTFLEVCIPITLLVPTPLHGSTHLIFQCSYRYVCSLTNLQYLNKFLLIKHSGDSGVHGLVVHGDIPTVSVDHTT